MSQFIVIFITVCASIGTSFIIFYLGKNIAEGMIRISGPGEQYLTEYLFMIGLNQSKTAIVLGIGRQT